MTVDHTIMKMKAKYVLNVMKHVSSVLPEQILTVQIVKLPIS